MRTARIELHCAVLLFGISGLFGKLVTANPAVIVFGRTFFASLVIFLGLRIYRKSLAPGSRKSLFLMMVSGLVLTLHWWSFFHAIQLSTVAVGLIGFATFPVFVTILEPALSGHKYRAVDFASAGLVVIGLIFVAPGFSFANQVLVGLLWAVFSGALFAVLTLMNRRLVADHSSFVVVFYQLGVATLCMLPFAAEAVQELDPKDLCLLLTLGIFCTALPHALFIKSLRTIKAQLASVVTALEPVYGIVLAAIFLHEIPRFSTLVGAVLVFVAVALAMTAHAPKNS
ncbi:MAG: DMT family transporter [Xanthomonadales bacterium]|nr:DMT family transporter [Xanthomonadales bacterium]